MWESKKKTLIVKKEKLTKFLEDIQDHMNILASIRYKEIQFTITHTEPVRLMCWINSEKFQYTRIAGRDLKK